MIINSAINDFRRRLFKWSKDNPKEFPWRTTKNLWHAMVAETMLQRTKVDQVLPVYEDFVNRFPTPKAFKNYIKNTDENIFENLGLKWRNETFKETVNCIVKEGIPKYKKDLKNLPGVGEYISSAFLSLHLNKRELLIDSNIVRFYGRFFGIPTDNETRRKKEFISLVEKVTPLRNIKGFNYAVLDYSMNICKPKPICNKCVLAYSCKFNQNKKND